MFTEIGSRESASWPGAVIAVTAARIVAATPDLDLIGGQHNGL
jgi:hypothetical protein